jgi:hypothetical protein
MNSDRVPVRALALFFDDIRLEIGGKLTLIGQYAGDLWLNPASQPTDRLAVLLHLTWPREYEPRNCAFRIEVTGQPPIAQDFPTPRKPDFSNKPLSPFSGILVQLAVHLRFPPLRTGDIIDVWCKVDDHELPAGRLRIGAPQGQPPEPNAAAVVF